MTAHDGVQLYVETWLPEEKDGKIPPAKIPTILIMTPYVAQGVEEYPGNATTPNFIQYFNARGYAVAQHHVRGTGESGGCLEQTSTNQFADGAAVVEYLGKEAPWSNGRVGMYGASYDAETQISTAAFGDPKQVKYLKAIIPVASVGGQYDWNFMDGVPWTGQPGLGNGSYLLTSLTPGEEPAPQHYPEKLTCQGDVMGSSADQNGDFTEYWQEREYRPNAPRVKAATLMVHGLRDFNVQDITLAGFAAFETPKMPAPLHVTGQPMLDLWLMSSRPDGHVAAKLEVIGPDGEPLRHGGSRNEYQATYGVRSLQHIDPMPHGWFEQEAGKEIATNEPVEVTIPEITLLHSCERPSFLRFRMPQPRARLLNVREIDEKSLAKLASSDARVGRRNGAGLATARVCGLRPRALPFQ
ncbi:MAG: CocE/NonD family hydrolase [Actinomycetota bacterium]